MPEAFIRRTCLGIAVMLAVGSVGLAEVAAEEFSENEAPIYATWRLMGEKEKTQFLAGYLYGYREAKVLGKIAVDYAKENPQNAAEGLTTLLPHYTLSTLTPQQLVPLLDDHFRKPENQSDSLRLSINKIQH